MSRSTTSAAVLCICSLTFAADNDRDWLIGKFDEAARKITGDKIAEPLNNDMGGVAWGNSYTLSGLAEMLAATGDPRDAELFIQLADKVCDARDNHRHVRDEFRNAELPGWSATKYNNGHRYTWAVHTGMIAEPLARFAAVVRGDAKLRERFAPKADAYLKVAQDAAAIHDGDFREGPQPGEGYLYIEPNKIHAPLNMQNALARAWIRIDEATGKPNHRERIEKLARFFKNRLRTTSDDAYVWAYRPPLQGTDETFEDISHAAINADFLTLCFEKGIVFQRQDVERLCRTFLTRVLPADGGPFDTLAGKGPVNLHRGQVLRWGRLARYDAAVRNRMMHFRRQESAGEIPSDLLGTALLVLSLNAATTQSAAVEKLGQPCRAFQVIGSCLVTDRGDGRERLVLMNDNESSGCELLYIDFEKNTGTMYPAPAGAGSWTVIEVPGDRLVTGTFYDGNYMIFDLTRMAFTKAVRFGNETYLWNLVKGSDGRVYGGSYPGGRLGALNLDTCTVDDCGAPAPPNQYLRTVSSTPWGEIVANFGMGEPITKVYNIATKQWRDFPGLAAKQLFNAGVTWNGYFVANDPRSDNVEAFKDASFTPVSPRPFPLPADDKCELNTRLTNAANLYLQHDGQLWHFTAGASQPQLKPVTDKKLRSGAFVARSRDGSLLGLKGQDYFLLHSGDRDPQFKPIPVEARGRPTMFLQADPLGRIWGGPHFGQTLFYYDTKSGKATNTRTICDNGGEVYDVAFWQDRIYAASYSGGDIVCYDPAAEWDQWNHRNPRTITELASKGYIRPIGGIRVGPDGRLYAGWMAKYGTYGGALSITDPATGKTELIENPLGTQAVASFDLDGQHVYLGTSLDANGLPHQPGPAKFGVLDVATGKVILEKSFATASAACITVEPATKLVALTVSDALQLFDPATSQFTENCIPDLPAITGSKLLPTGDGGLIAACGKQIIRIDVHGRTFAVIAEAPVEIQCMTLAPDRRVYFTHEADLYRTLEPLPASIAGR